MLTLDVSLAPLVRMLSSQYHFACNTHSLFTKVTQTVGDDLQSDGLPSDYAANTTDSRSCFGYFRGSLFSSRAHSLTVLVQSVVFRPPHAAVVIEKHTTCTPLPGERSGACSSLRSRYFPCELVRNRAEREYYSGDTRQKMNSGTHLRNKLMSSLSLI